MHYLITKTPFHLMILELYDIVAEPFDKEQVMVPLNDELKAVLEEDGVELVAYRVAMNVN